MPDKEKITSLVRAAQAGDGLAFAELVRAYQDIAVAYATAILRDYHLAEDAAQEAFVEAYRELPALREPAAFAAWFRTVIFKHCDRMTRRKRHPVAALDLALEVASPEPSPQETLELQETRASVWKAIAALSEAERAVVLLYYMGEHSQAVIAEFLNITANAVKTRLYSARKRLRKYMERVEESLNAARPSGDSRFAEKVQRMIRPEALKKNDNLYWSPGIGADVWEMFCAAITGDLETIKRLLDKDPSLARSHYEYRTPRLPDDPPWATPLAWATRRGHQAIVRLLTAYEQTGALPAHSLEEYEAVARALVEAYQSGDDAAMQCVIERFQLQRPLTWDQPPREVQVARLRRGVQERLGRRSGAEDESATLDLADAQFLVARSLGFESWTQLTKHLNITA